MRCLVTVLYNISCPLPAVRTVVSNREFARFRLKYGCALQVEALS